jgi:hypothetical protein
MRKICTVAIAGLIAFGSGLARADGMSDTRTLVPLPDMMKNHMMGSMRDHLLSIEEIITAMGKGKLDEAADIAEGRIGMSSLAAHDAAHMAPFMPQQMQDIGTEMHHAASRFAIVAREGDNLRALDSLSKVTQQCVACHAAYRIH